MGDFWGNDVSVKEDRYIKPDGWAYGSRIRKDEIEFATWRIPTNSGGPIESLAIEVEVTGRTLQRRQGSYYVRVKVIFKGDCEPDTTSPGWMMIF